MRFKVYGPYEIGVEKAHAGWIDKEDTENFWKNVVVADYHKLPDACGVYLFGMRGLGKKGMAGKTLPWYVGKAEKQKFKTECFNFKNLYYFNSILTNEYKGKGSPFLYLLARVEENDEFSPPATKEDFWGLRFVEEMFIQMSLSANSDLFNKSTTKMARETSIRGLLNTRKYKSVSVDEFKGVFGIIDREPAQVVQYEKTAFRYEVYGPYDIPMKNANKVKEKAIDAEGVKGMWDDLREGERENILFRTLVAYMWLECGLARTRPRGMSAQLMIGALKVNASSSDIEKLEKVFNNKKGTPVIYFLPRLVKKNESNEPAKPVKKMPHDIEFVKKVFLEYGIQTNKEILSRVHIRDAEILRDPCTLRVL